MPRRLTLAAVAFFSCGLACAQSVVSEFAPGQLRHAEALLQQARQAAAQGDYERARQLAAQAGLDARLAYGMSDSPFLRRDATRVHRESSGLLQPLAGHSQDVIERVPIPPHVEH